MLYKTIAVASTLASVVNAQSAGSEQDEQHPSLTWQRCSGTGGGSCQDVQGEIVLDANWRWLHVSDGYTNCYTGNEWNATACPNNDECSENCVVEGVDYSGTYGIEASGDSLSLAFVTEHEYGTNVGSRTYLMEDASTYQMFDLLNNEFTFTVDVSQLDCGLNGALYFVGMDAAGQGEAGAEYGLGYCDSQCPRDLKFIDGTANVDGWEPSESDENAGVGGRGACCAEMDIWEANGISQALTPHSCDSPTFVECQGENCGGTYSDERYAGPCDPNGCDFNPYRVGVTDFYGPGMTVDTNQPLTVVTQFVAEGGSLSEIRRYYVQGGEVIEQPEPTYEGLEGNTITQDWCDRENEVFEEEVYPFNDHGGMASMSEAMEIGMVLVMSIWGDHYAHMLWLDSSYPLDAPESQPGVARGTCSQDSGDPDELIETIPDATVTFSEIKFGPIGSTFDMPAARAKTKERKAREARREAARQ